ncbi:hypothetical protein PMZ80_010245 [Knufia obscura]|uniref:Uncharacterized protein n=2 Tax=Knufia TaxID=430999 RepID=A0AAN8I5H9_9EURO|nr:hypothetical protein PMZ80_010245 [Knufia obscura]KAK5952984.1 hypothetical protein OHC33_006105 [Knufia fluminis]
MAPTQDDIKAYLHQYIEAKYCDFLAEQNKAKFNDQYIKQPPFCRDISEPNGPLEYMGTSFGPQEPSHNDGRDTGIIIGAIVGFILLVWFVGWLICELLVRKRRRRAAGRRTWFGQYVEVEADRFSRWKGRLTGRTGV